MWVLVSCGQEQLQFREAFPVANASESLRIPVEQTYNSKTEAGTTFDQPGQPAVCGSVRQGVWGGISDIVFHRLWVHVRLLRFRSISR